MTEDHPHIVYSKQYPYTGIAWLCPNYRAAYDRWAAQHSYLTPYLIATRGRVIDPSTPVIDVNE